MLFHELCGFVVLRTTFDNMKRLGFRSSSLSTEEKANARTKLSQNTEPQLFYIVCWRVVVCHFISFFIYYLC